MLFYHKHIWKKYGIQVLLKQVSESKWKIVAINNDTLNLMSNHIGEIVPIYDGSLRPFKAKILKPR